MSHDIFFDEQTHTYLVDGRETPSTTTVLSLLTNLEYKEINAFILEQAAKRGTAVHEYCELYDYDALPEADEYGIIGYIKAYADFVRDYRCKWEQVERPVCSSKLGYAGTLDRAGIVEGKQAVVDIKTIASPTKMNKMVLCMQTAAYAQAREETCGVKTEKRYGLYLKANGEYSVLDCENYEKRYDFNAFEVFKKCLLLYNIYIGLKQAKPKREKT